MKFLKNLFASKQDSSDSERISHTEDQQLLQYLEHPE